MWQISLIPEAGKIMTTAPSQPWVGVVRWIQPPTSQQTLLSVLSADPNTLFRSNSLASKSMEQFMKVSR